MCSFIHRFQLLSLPLVSYTHIPSVVRYRVRGWVENGVTLEREMRGGELIWKDQMRREIGIRERMWEETKNYIILNISNALSLIVRLINSLTFIYMQVLNFYL